MLPALRKNGMYELNKKIKKDYIELNKKFDDTKKNLIETKKRVKQLENNQNKKKFLKHPAVYIIRPSVTSNKKMNKIGSCEDPNKRFPQYNTTVPDNVQIVDVFYVKDHEGVEQCAKGILHKYLYRTGRGKGKEYYKCSKKQIVDAFDACVFAMEGKHISEIQTEIKGLNRQNYDDDKVEIFEFDSKQNGGYNKNDNFSVESNQTYYQEKTLKYLSKSMECMSKILENMTNHDV